MTSKSEEVLQRARSLYATSPDWITFQRTVLGPDGLLRQMFPDTAELASFEASPEYLQIMGMNALLRDKGPSVEGKEPTRVITVRLPASVHESLKHEADEKKTSVNKLCITKLLMVLEEGAPPPDLAPPARHPERKEPQTVSAPAAGLAPQTQETG